MPDAKLLFLHALTGLHPGGGTALGVVDLPVARERHTKWPLIPGSSLKGVLRAACGGSLDKSEIAAVFGPETSNAGRLRRRRVADRRAAARLSRSLAERRLGDVPPAVELWE